EDMFSGELDEQAVLAKHKVSRSLYDRWLADDGFAEQFSRRIASAHRQSELIIARYAPLAAAKLVQLTESENQETARKACLDIISLPKTGTTKIEGPDKAGKDSEKQAEQLPEATASRLLAALAES
ncbi:MAG: hypothetical protein ACYTEO_15340, partial [Planctomycetota bacterium]